MKDYEYKSIRYSVEIQGQIEVNEYGVGHITIEHDDVIVCYVDLCSKYAEVWATGSLHGFVMVGPNERTLGKLDVKEEATAIVFPDHRDFSVISAHVARYTLCVVLGKETI